MEKRKALRGKEKRKRETKGKEKNREKRKEKKRETRGKEKHRDEKKRGKEKKKSWLVDWVLWYIKLCMVFNAKSIFMQIVSSFSNNSVQQECS